MSAFTVSSATAVRAPVRVAARRTAGAKIARGSVLARYTVTLETPEGTQAIECADDTYILDAAEVRRAPRARLDSRREDARRRARHIFFFVCVSIHRAVHRCGGPSRRRARTRSNPSRGESRSRSISIHIHLGVDRTGRAFGGRAFGARASTADFYARAFLPSPRRRPASTFRTRAARAPAPRARARSRCVRRHRTNPRGGGLCEGL